jgi:esterase/lipase
MRHSEFKRFLVFFMLTVALAGCATLPPRLQESGLNSRFNLTPDVPFDAYIRQSERMIERARVDINETNREVVLNANLPFELIPDESRFPRNRQGLHERGILLIHGLSDSPYFLKPIARQLRDRGFLVRAILLPGHGTVPGDLLSVTHQDWIEATKYGVDQLKPRVEKLYLGGFSTGGALCLLEALTNPDIQGLILFAPAVGLKSPWAFMADLMKIFSDWLGGQGDDKDYAKYESFAINGGAQVYRLTREIDAAFASGKRLSVPVLTVVSAEDISVDTDKMFDVFSAYITSPESVLLYYGKETAKSPRDPDMRILFRKSFLPEERILDFAHISLLIPPDDPHYGKNGGYRYCLHYRDDREKRMACLHDPHVRQGEITPQNLERFTLRRLTYNPRFEEMIQVLDRFLDRLASP